MAYGANSNAGSLDTLTNSTIASGDLAIFGDISDSNRAKAITLTNLETKIASDLNLSGINTGDQTLSGLGGANSALSNLASVAINTDLLLGTSDGGALGSATKMWSDLFLASGSVINWNAGDITLTHSANRLDFAGATTGYAFDSAVIPASNDGAALGSTSLKWSDLWLASGAVLNFNSGNVVVTHSSGVLTVGTGILTLSNGVNVGAAGINLKDSSDTYPYIISVTDTASGSHFLNLTLHDATHTLDLTGNLTVSATSSIGGTAYVVGGTDVSLADGGTGASLADPNADRIMFWDDSAGQVTFLTAGTGLTITGTTITAATGGVPLTEVSGLSQTAAVNNGYITNNAGQVVVALPTTAAVGDVIRVIGSGAGGWKVSQSASQVIIADAGGVAGLNQTTTGTGGYIASTDRYDAVELVCITANTTFSLLTDKGNITIL